MAALKKNKKTSPPKAKGRSKTKDRSKPLEPELAEVDRELKEGRGEKTADPPLPAAPAEVTVADPLRRYLWEISRYELLEREEEIELAKKYQEGQDPEAAAKLVKANLRLVVKIALDFQRFWMRNLLDLIQEGNIGLIQAVKKFDPFRGIKFSYYASFWIKAYVLKFIMDNWKLVKVGTTQAQRRLFYNLKKEKERLQAQGFEPTAKLLAQNLEVRESEVIEMDQRLDAWELSLDSPLREDGKNQYKDFLPADQPSVEEAVAEVELKNLLKGKLVSFRETLSGKELAIFDQRIMAEQPATLHEVGEQFNISRERVRQIQARLVKKIGEFLAAEIPDFEDSFQHLGE